ncbi:MAG: hypothetical protein ACPG7F_14400 [Aggregatilineales bacterium]
MRKNRLAIFAICLCMMVTVAVSAQNITPSAPDPFELTRTQQIANYTQTISAFATAGITLTPDSFVLTATELVANITRTVEAWNITQTASVEYLATLGITATPEPTRIPSTSSTEGYNSQENVNLQMTGIVTAAFLIVTIFWILLRYIKERRDYQKAKRKNVDS